MYTPSPYLVAFDGSFSIADAETNTNQNLSKQEYKSRLKKTGKNLKDLQKRWYAENKRALLIVFQAMDAAGKDSTIRAVFSGINPQGCSVRSFKRPTSEELSHDFLWRITPHLPAKGMIGIFNRSHYEEVLITKVFPQLLNYQKLPTRSLEDEFASRFETIRQFEKHLHNTGTTILKFWLNISQQEQKRRLLARIDTPEKNWKHESGDLKMRENWPAFTDAYQRIFDETSREFAPWYAIPADEKPTMRCLVAEIIKDTLERLNPQYPTLSAEELAALKGDRKRLLNL
jgi:PPK2 family polyphosphate:nucleotide phosphotransferase